MRIGFTNCIYRYPAVREDEEKNTNYNKNGCFQIFKREYCTHSDGKKIKCECIDEYSVAVFRVLCQNIFNYGKIRDAENHHASNKCIYVKTEEGEVDDINHVATGERECSDDKSQEGSLLQKQDIAKCVEEGN